MSYIKREKIDYPGNDIRYIQAPYSKVQEACDQDPNCVGFGYREIEKIDGNNKSVVQEGWLKNKLGNSQPLDNFVTYVKSSKSNIRWLDSGRCLDIPNGDTKLGANLQLWDCNNTDAQDFIYDPNTKAIQSKKTPNRCLDIPQGKADYGVNIQLWDCNNSDAQKFEYDNGAIKTVLNRSLAIDIDNGQNKNGTKVQLWGYNKDNNNQKFKSELFTNISQAIQQAQQAQQKPPRLLVQRIVLQRNDNKPTPLNIQRINVYDTIGNIIPENQIKASLTPQYGDINVFGPQFLINGKDGKTTVPFAHTDSSPNAQMVLTFTGDQEIGLVEIVNRLDCCQDRIVGSIVRFINSQGVEVYSENITDIKPIYSYKFGVDEILLWSQIQEYTNLVAQNLRYSLINKQDNAALLPKIDLLRQVISSKMYKPTDAELNQLAANFKFPELAILLKSTGILSQRYVNVNIQFHPERIAQQLPYYEMARTLLKFKVPSDMILALFFTRDEQLMKDALANTVAQSIQQAPPAQMAQLPQAVPVQLSGQKAQNTVTLWCADGDFCQFEVPKHMALGDRKILFRGANDWNHTLEYNSTFDGPRLSGYAGGALGTNADNGKNILTWNKDGSVNIASNLNVSNRNILQELDRLRRGEKW